MNSNVRLSSALFVLDVKHRLAQRSSDALSPTAELHACPLQVKQCIECLVSFEQSGTVDFAVDVNQAVNGITLLGAACQAPCATVAVAMTRALLDRNADVNVGSVPVEWLQTVASSGLRVPRVRSGESRAELSTDWRAQLPLKLASAAGHTQVVSALIEAGADPNDASGPSEKFPLRKYDDMVCATRSRHFHTASITAVCCHML
jgi:ankyrin repeat protein